MTLRWEIALIVSVFAVPAVLLFPAIHVRATLTASLRSRSIQFTSAPWKNSAGIFNSDDTPLDLTVEGYDRIESRDPSDPSAFKSGEPVTLRGVRLHSLDVTQPLRVSLEADRVAVGMIVERIGPGANWLAYFS